MSSPLHHFRIYPGSTRSYYFQVGIFQNQRAMHREAGRYNFIACLEGFQDKKKPKWIGNLYFNQHQFGSGLVAHELLHATFWWHRIFYKTQDLAFPEPVRRNGLRVIVDKEEEMSLVIEHLTKQFWKAAYECGAAS